MPAIYAVVAALWIGTIIYAQLNCSLIASIGTLCDGERLNFWMLPFYTSPFGALGLLGLILTALVALRRRYQGN